MRAPPLPRLTLRFCPSPLFPSPSSHLPPTSPLIPSPHFFSSHIRHISTEPPPLPPTPSSSSSSSPSSSSRSPSPSSSSSPPSPPPRPHLPPQYLRAHHPKLPLNPPAHSPSSSSSPSSHPHSPSPHTPVFASKKSPYVKQGSPQEKIDSTETHHPPLLEIPPGPHPPLLLEQEGAVKMAGYYVTSGRHTQFNQDMHKILQGEGIEAAISKSQAEKYRHLENVPMIDSFDIFTNSEVRLSEVGVFGFDYDYTLAQYTDHIQTEIYDMALNVLIHDFKYPAQLAGFKYDPNFAIRGLHYDMEKGYLMKLDFLLNIQLGAIYFGRQLVSKEEAIDVYGSLQLRESYANSSLRIMSDIFCLPETCLISDVIDFLMKFNFTFEPHIIYEDVTRAVNMIHKNGSLHKTILRDIHRYLEPNPALGALLAKLKRAGKKLFMLTNSPYNFADAGMQYMLQGHLPSDKKHWTELFDVIITQCDKPNYFGRGRSFRIQDQETGRLFWHKIDKFEPGQVYVGGNLTDFTSISGWKGNQVLYFGDHLFSDLMEPSVREGWRTGVIINELEREVEIQNTTAYRRALSELMATEEILNKCQYYHGPDREGALRALKNRRFDIRLALKEPFNKHFGSVFRTHSNATMFAHGLQQYADLYTCKIENFLACPLDFSFYPARNFLPHEFKLN